MDAQPGEAPGVPGDLVLFEARAAIATIILNRPERLNAFNRALDSALTEVLLRFERNDALRVAILTGAGDRAFCAGADIRDLAPSENVIPPFTLATFGRKPVIAVVNGYALGGGLEMAMACDIRIASERAIFGHPEATFGVTVGWGASQRLPRQIPWCKAAELLLVGQRIDAQEACRIGLVNKVVPHDALMAEANAWADTICRQGPIAVRATKEAMVRGADVPLPEGLRIEQEMFDRARRSADADEAIRTFAEKRAPRFENR